MTTSVFVSGATGFIAQHICKLLLEQGYKVVGTVRSAEKGAHLTKLLDSASFTYEIVKDVEPVGAFDEAIKKHPEVTVFLHTASPFHFLTDNPEKDLLQPAVNGTKNALQAIKEHGPQIERVVVTSSYAAISTAGNETKPDFVCTEKTWNEITWDEAKKDPFAGYRGSKTFAEKAVWEFVKEEKPKFTVNVVNPSYVFGPQAFDSELKTNLNTSSEILNNLLKLKPDSPVPDHKGGFVDVRDVAAAHLVAFEKNIANERLLMNAGRFASQSLLDIINSKFELLRGKIPKGEPGSGDNVDKQLCVVDNKHTLALLGFELRDLETTVYDSVEQIVKYGNAKF